MTTVFDPDTVLFMNSTTAEIDTAICYKCGEDKPADTVTMIGQYDTDARCEDCYDPNEPAEIPFEDFWT